MPPIGKENELLTAAPSALSAECAAKPQPVALEVPVTVNGARSADGSDKREPFSETTKTVLIFGNGAVIRLSSSVAPGQLLFLTNEKTKKEVVCQVVKSKNYRNVSGYVELEFTEGVVGFWGMRFPGDRLAAPSSVPQALGSPAAGSATPLSAAYLPRTIAPKVETSAPTVAQGVPPAKPSIPAPTPINRQSKYSESKFAAPPATGNAAPEGPASRVFETPRATDAQVSIFAPPQEPVVLSTLEGADFSPVSDADLIAPSAVNPAPAHLASDPEMEALKQHTARLQEELSRMQFSESAKSIVMPSAAKKTKTAPPVNSRTKASEFADAEPEEAPVKAANAPKPAASPTVFSLDEEQLQIPAWLEPLARNAAAPTSTQELIEREKSKRLAEQTDIMEELSADIVPPAEAAQVSEQEAPTFSNSLSFEQGVSTDESDPKKSGKGLLLAAIAATVLITAGGAGWYMQQNSNSMAASPSAPAKPPIQLPASSSTVAEESLTPPASAVQQVSSRAQNTSTGHGDLVSQTKPVQSVTSLAPASTPAAAAHTEKAAASSNNGGASPATVASSQHAAAQPKKLALGDVQLAAPTVKKHGGGEDTTEAEASMALNSDPREPNSDALAAGLTMNTEQPAPPAAVPVGGDVKPAKLLTSAPPTYPMMAKNQRVSGNVLIDALIDINGRVTTMKVVSGPALLHQAAMDALRQWKYRPALLDGKPVSMHLTVTIQFRLQ